MEDRFDINNLQEQLEKCNGYMIGITFLNKGILTNHFLTNNFPIADIKISLAELGKLAEAALKSENKNETDK